MKIEKLKFENIKDVIKFYNKLLPVKNNLNKTKNKYKKIVKNKNYITLVAKIEDEIVGTLTGIVCDSIALSNFDFMVVDYLYVSENYRRKNIATSLFSEIEKYAKEFKCGYILFVSSANKVEAHKLYEKLGYTEEKGYRKVMF